MGRQLDAGGLEPPPDTFEAVKDSRELHPLVWAGDTWMVVAVAVPLGPQRQLPQPSVRQLQPSLLGTGFLCIRRMC